MAEIVFPVFLKYSNGQSFFYIRSAEEMTEVKLIGKKWCIFHVLASTHPDRVLINDILTQSGNNIVKSTVSEFQEYFNKSL